MSRARIPAPRRRRSAGRLDRSPVGRYTPHLPRIAPAEDRHIADEREIFDDTKVKVVLFKIWDNAPWIFLYGNPEVNAINRRLQWSGGRRDEYPIFTGASSQA
jgi:hypothetical protein